MNQQNQLKSFIARITAALVFILIACPTEVRADDSGFCGDPNVNGGQNVTWSYIESTHTLTISGTGAMANYPQYYNCPWNNYIYNIQTAVIEEGVTSIGDNTIHFCLELSSISIPSSVKSIGSGAFARCNRLVSVDIPSSVTTIGNDAFFSAGLTSLTIPSSVKSIGKHAFAECQALSSITISEGVTSIGDNAFDYCKALASISIPASTTSIGDKAFANCFALTEIKVDNNNTVYKSEDGVLFSKDGKTLIFYPAGKTATIYTIPDDVELINKYAFYSSQNITSVTFPASVKSIGAGAFQICKSLSSITIPSSVTSIENRAFYTCSNLKTVYIQRYDATSDPSITTLDENTFLSCHNDLVIYIPTAGFDTYKAATNWSSYTEKMKPYDGFCGDPNENEGKNVVWAYDKSTLTISGSGAMDYYDGLVLVPWKDYQVDIKTVIIESGVTIIGAKAFENCVNLSSVSIPAGVTTFGNAAFNCCSCLSSVTIPSSVTSIGNEVFAVCLNLKTVYVLRYDDNADPKITTLGNEAFKEAPDDFVILVPFEALDIYKYADGWKDYADKILYQNGAININKDNNGMHATLDDNYTGTAAINITSDIKVSDVTLNREFTAGVYSTIVLPFGVSTSNLSGIESIAQFSGVEKDNNDVWTASMTELWNDESTSPVTLSAYTPYVVKMKVGTLSLTGLTDVVTLKKTVKPETTDGDWTFVGTLAPTALPIDGEHDYGFAGSSNADNSVSAGDFVHLVSGASAKPFRAYLKYTGTDTNWAKTRSNEPMPSRIQVQILKLNGQATAIGTLDTRTGEISSDEWYSIDGRRLSGKPNSKGIYINHGKKVVVR